MGSVATLRHKKYSDPGRLRTFGDRYLDLMKEYPTGVPMDVLTRFAEDPMDPIYSCVDHNRERAYSKYIERQIRGLILRLPRLPEFAREDSAKPLYALKGSTVPLREFLRHGEDVLPEARDRLTRVLSNAVNFRSLTGPGAPARLRNLATDAEELVRVVAKHVHAIEANLNS